MTTKSDKPLWVQHMEGTVSAPENDYYKTSSSTLPLRYRNGKSGEDTLTKGKDTTDSSKAYGKGTPSDTASLLSRSSGHSSKSERKRNRTIALVIILIIIALLLAIGFGFLMYYLLMKDDTGAWRHRTIADSSVRILNSTYTPEMADNSSLAFQRISEPFCQEMDKYFLDSDYGRQYNGCHVVALRDVGERPDCTCYAKGGGSVEVLYKLSFFGNLEKELTSKIPDIIEKHTRKQQIDDALHVLIKNFLIDIRVLWKEKYNGILADAVFPVYNLTYKPSLMYRNSTEFQTHAGPFCRDIDDFLRNSWLRSRYISCEVIRFGNKPNSVAVELKFRGEDIRDIQTGLIHLIMSRAKNVTVDRSYLKMIGNLLVVPFDMNLVLRPVVIAYSTTPKPTTTTTEWPGDGVYIKKTFRLVDFIYDPSLAYESSPQFRSLSLPFCKDLSRLFQLSKYASRYYSCRVENFNDRPESILFTVLFRGQDWRGLGDPAVNVVREYAPRILGHPNEVYRVGTLHVLLGEGDKSIGPTFLPLLTSSILPSSSAYLVHDGVRLDTYLKLYNLTYTDALGNPSSPVFRRQIKLFCDDLRRFYGLGRFGDRFYDCEASGISPSTILYFSLVFRGRETEGLEDSLFNSIKEHAQTVVIGTRKYYRVGDLLVLPRDSFITAVPTNITMATTTVDWQPSSTPIMTSLPEPSSSIYTGPLSIIPLTYRLYGFNFLPQLLDPQSEEFRNIQSALCRELTNVYSETPVLESLYYDCRVENFRSDPNKITFNIQYKTRGSQELLLQTKDALESRLPHHNITGSDSMLYEVIPTGGLLLLLKEYPIEPDIKTVTKEPPVASSSIIIMPDEVTLRMTYLLYDFEYKPELAFPQTKEFWTLETRLCEALKIIYQRTIALGHVFQSCTINEFGRDPNSITFQMDFTSRYPELLRTIAVETLHKSAPHVFYPPYEVLPVSGLNFILDNYIVTATSYVTTSSILPTSTQMMSSTADITTTPPPYMTKTSHVYGLFNLTFDMDLLQDSSSRYQYLQSSFCDGIKKLYSMTYLKSVYRDCKIVNFTNTDVSDPKKNAFAFSLLFETPDFPGLHDKVIWTIEEFSPQRQISGYNITRIGDLNLILGTFRSSLVDNTTSRYEWEPRSSYFETRRSSISVTLTSTPMMTSSVPPTTTEDPRLSYILSLFNYGLVNFQYHPDLSDKDSKMFLIYQQRFCDDVFMFYRSSPLAAAYRDCEITDITPDGKNVSFRLWFQTPWFPSLQEHIVEIFENMAPKRNVSTPTGVVLALDVGNIFLRWKEFTNRLVVREPDTTTLTWTPPSTSIMPTSTSTFTTSSTVITTPPPPPKWIRAVFKYGLHEFKYYPKLADNESLLFQLMERRFCEDASKLYYNSYLAAAYRDCEIREFTSDGENITFSFAFETPNNPGLLNYILKTLETAPKVNRTGWTVLDVGGIYLKHRNLSYILITPDPSVTTVTWIAPSTTVVPTSTVLITTPTTTPTTTPPPNWLRAVFKYGLLNFSYYPKLKDPDSRLFKMYEVPFCEDIKRFYQNSVLAAAYRDCKIRNFSSDPSVEFGIEFDTPLTPKLQYHILNILETMAPHKNKSLTEVMGVGYLDLILKNFTYVIVTKKPEESSITWVPPSTPVPTSTIKTTPSTTPTTPMPTTTTPPPAWLLATFNYSTFRFTWEPDLVNKNSFIYKYHQEKFCADVERFFSKTYLRSAYKGCEITHFGKDNTIQFRFKFDVPVFPSLQSDILTFFENGGPRLNITNFEVMDVGDIYLIVKNFTYAIIDHKPDTSTIHWVPSTTIMATSTQETTTSSIVPTTTTSTTTTPSPPDWLYALFEFSLLNFEYKDQLANPDSFLFKWYEQKFCEDIKRFYDNSYFKFTYRDCKILEFRRDGRIKFHIGFETPVFPNLMTDIIDTLYTEATKIDISLNGKFFHVLSVGEQLLIWDNRTMIIIPPPEYSTTLTWTPTSSSVPPTSSSIESSMSSIEMPSSTTPEPPLYVLAIFRFGLMNFTYYPELGDRDSFLFNAYQQSFCSDIQNFYLRSKLAGSYRECQISEFTDDSVKFIIYFETPVSAKLQSDILHVLETSPPRLNISQCNTPRCETEFMVLDVGDLFLIWANFTFVMVTPDQSTVRWTPTITATPTMTTPSTIPTTTEPSYQLKISFEVLNLTMSPALADPSSPQFRFIEEQFCQDISNILRSQPKKFPDYQACNIEIFMDDPLRIFFNLVFSGQQPGRMKELVVDILIEDSPRFKYFDLIGLRVGNILIAVDNFTVQIDNYSTQQPPLTSPVAYDALLYNITFDLYPANFSMSMLDKSSPSFKQLSDSFCNSIRSYFQKSFLRERFYGCRIDTVSDGNPPRLVAYVIIAETYDFGAPLIFDIIKQSSSQYVIDGRQWFQIGDLLVYTDYPGDAILIELGYYTTTPSSVTSPLPDSYTILDMTANIVNGQWDPALADTSSQQFSAFAIPFCEFLGERFSVRNRFKDYFGCKVVSFTENPFSVQFSLGFRGRQENYLQQLVRGIIIEWTRMQDNYYLQIGPLTLDEWSLFVLQRFVDGGGFTPITVPPPTLQPPEISTQAPNPCPPGVFNRVVPHEKQCSKFYLCNGGEAMEISCAGGQILDPNYGYCVPQPPGFVCPL